MANDRPLLLSEAVEFCRAHGRPITRQGLRHNIVKGHLRAERYGHYVIVHHADLQEWLAAHPADGRSGRRAA